jgi:hypothetical protein
MPGEDLHLSMLVHAQAHLNRFAVGAFCVHSVFPISLARSLP